MHELDKGNELLDATYARRGKTAAVRPGTTLKVGVDLGTASIVVVVLDENDTPLTWEMEEASVIRDGLVVDFAGAGAIVRRLKGRIEEHLGAELRSAAIAVPPGTGVRDCATHGYVVESAGLEVTSVLDEPTAANAVLGIRDGAIVDIGGGTTGIAVFSEIAVSAVFDEPTGGTHVSLVIAGNRKIPFPDAERLKQDPRMHRELLPLVTPVLQKMASIVLGARCEGALSGRRHVLPGGDGACDREGDGNPRLQTGAPVPGNPIRYSDELWKQVIRWIRRN